MISREAQTRILHDAARQCNLDGHVKVADKKVDLYTFAERMMGHFGWRRGVCYKQSYLCLDSVDTCFYINEYNKACCTFTAQWQAGAVDLMKLDTAGALVNKLLNEIQSLIDSEIQKMVKT